MFRKDRTEFDSETEPVAERKKRGSPKARRSYEEKSGLQYEKLEDLQMMSGTPADPSNLYFQHEQTPTIAETRSLVGTITESKTRILSTLQIVQPSLQDDVLRTYSPAYTAAIDAVFADGIGTPRELSMLVISITKTQTITLQQMRDIMGDPDFLDPSEWESRNIESLPSKTRSAELQKRFNIVYATLVQTAQTLQYLEAKLQPLLAASVDRTETVSTDFSQQPQGPVADGTVLNMEHLGRLKIFHGGFTPPVITGNTLRNIGYQDSYSTHLLDSSMFIRSVQVRYYEGGPESKLLLSLGLQNTYFPIQQTASQVIDVNMQANAISLIVRSGMLGIENITFDKVIPGTGITPEILSLQEAIRKLTTIHENGLAELGGLFRTKLVTGSVVPPGMTLTQYQNNINSDFQSIDASILSLGAVDTTTLRAMNAYGQSLSEQGKKLTVTMSDLEGRVQFATRSDKTALSTLIQRGKQSLVSVRSAILAWQNGLRERWSDGIERISPTLYTSLKSLVDGRELHILSDTANAATFQIGTTAEREAKAEVGTTVAEGKIKLTSLRGTDDEAPMLSATSNGALVLKGQAGVLDFSGAKGTVVRASLTMNTTNFAEDKIFITFVRGNKALKSMFVTNGEPAVHEDKDGITGVVMKNAADMMGADARAFFEYRANYVSGYNYPWQDPGPEHHFFVTVRPDLFPRKAEIIAEANKGDVYQPTTITSTDLSLDMDRPLIADALNTENSVLVAQAASRRIDSVYLPNNYWAVPVEYNPNEYNAFSLTKFRGNPYIDSVGYEATNGTYYALPEDMIIRSGDQIIVKPTGRDMRIAVAVRDGNCVRSNTPVNFVYDCDIVRRISKDMPDTLISEGSVIKIDDISMFTMNNGGALGWRDGAWLSNQSQSPVAVGWLKGRARITNRGNEAISFTVTTYSGFPGTPGWDASQGSYQGSLGAGESRLLTDDIYMLGNQGGSSIARFVVRDSAGRLLAEGKRPVNAPSMPPGEQAMQLNAFKERWAAALAQAQQDTRAYFASLGLPAPSMGDPATIVAGFTTNGIPTAPTIADLENDMRQAFRILAHAKESGDLTRIAYAETTYTNSLTMYLAAEGQQIATPSTPLATQTTTVLTQEQGIGGSPDFVLLASTNQSIMELYNGSLAIQSFQTENSQEQSASILQQHYSEMYQYSQGLFSQNQRTTTELTRAMEWLMQNASSLMGLTGHMSILDAAKAMMRSFANGALSIPTAHAENGGVTTNLDQMSQAITSNQATVNSLNTGGIQVNTRSLAGRMYVWLIQKLESTTDFGTTVDIAKAVEGVTNIPWWKILERVWATNTHERITPSVTRFSLRHLFTLGQYGSTFTSPNATTVGIPDAQTNKFIGSSPTDPLRETYRTFQFIKPDGGMINADHSIRVRFDAIMPDGTTMYNHIDVYLHDRYGKKLLHPDGSDIRLTPNSVRGMLFVDIPLSLVTKHIALDPLQSGGPGQGGVAFQKGGFTLKVAMWFSSQQGAPGYGKVTTKVFEVEELTVPKADVSHLPILDRDIYESIRPPVPTNHDWKINLASGFHDGSGLYALDFNASGDNDIKVIAPGSAAIIPPTLQELIDGTAKIKIKTATQREFIMTLMHLDKMFKNQTGIEYTPMSEVFVKENMMNIFANQIAAANALRETPMTQTREFYDFFKNLPEAKAKLDSYVARIEQLRVAITAYINAGNLLSDTEQFAEIGNEGYSDGSHLHLQINELSRSIEDYGWIDAYFPGIKFDGAMFNNGKNLNGLVYSRSLGVLVHEETGIAMRRENIPDNSSNGFAALNSAYAIESGSIGRELHWDGDNNAWLAWSNGDWIRENGQRLKWIKLSPGIFTFISI